MGKTGKITAFLLTLCMALGIMTTGALAAESSYTDLTGTGWKYDDGTLTAISDTKQTVEKASVLMISDTANGRPVTAVRSNGFDNVVVGHKANQYILIPAGITAISAKAFYDFNFVKAVSIPATVTEIDYNAFDVLGREINNATVIYGAAGSAAESWAADNSTAVYDFSPAEENFTARAGENGSVYPCGAWHVPEGLKADGCTAQFSIEANSGYVVESLTADGKEITAAEGQRAYLLAYAFGESSESIEVTFRKDESGEVTRGEGAAAAEIIDISLAAGASAPLDIFGNATDCCLVDNAVAEGMDIADVYDPVPASTSGYTASMGISTGDYYVQDGMVYEMVFGTNGNGLNGGLDMAFTCKAELVNYLYETKGWVYGEDYDLIRLFHYNATVNGGNRKGAYDFHCAFAYKALDVAESYTGLAGQESFYSTNSATMGISDNSTLFVQGTRPSSVVIEGLKAECDTRPDGPQEATNFYGLGSAVLVDGGTPSLDASYATTIFDKDDVVSLKLIDPEINGGANPLYTLASSLVEIEGGTMFTGFSGGHGPYASLQGQIVINVDEDIVDENGVINTDVADLTANVLADRPGRFGWAERNTDAAGNAIAANDHSVSHAKRVLDEDGIAAYEAKNGPVTVVTTANSSGSLLVTDSGGGIVVANRFAGTAYSTGSSGVYSMGGGSYIYLYNSRLESHIEPALNSVGEGYIFAFNSEMSGPVGILSSGGSDHVQIHNSAITTELDFNMDFYDLTDPNDPAQLAAYEQLLKDVDAKELVNSNFLMIFPLNGDDMANFVSNWYDDRTQVPGKNGGNIALISTTSSSGITVEATKLTNNAYAERATEGVPNWLVAAFGGQTTVNFRDENDKTSWDLTGADNGTTELYGNLYCAGPTGSGMWARAAGSLVANMENSQWTGTIENAGDGVTLKLDGASRWTVTGTCTVAGLSLEKGAVIEAPAGCELAFEMDGKAVASLDAGDYENVHITVTQDGTVVYDGIYTEEETEPEMPAEETASAEPAGQNASQEQGAASGEAGSGEMGSGEMPGGPGVSGECNHEDKKSVVAVSYTVADPDVAEVTDGQITALKAGTTEIEVRLTCVDGTVITKNIKLAVQ